jgi:hypothetical protein
MRTLIFIPIACLVSLTLTAEEPTATDKDSAVPIETAEKPLNFWMQKKLDYSSGILKGFSLGDFALIESNAQQMRLLNKIEGFVRSRNDDYRTNLHTFERVTDEIIREAKGEDIDGVVFAYHQLTTSCVRCHQTLRESNPKSTRKELPDTH